MAFLRRNPSRPAVDAAAVEAAKLALTKPTEQPEGEGRTAPEPLSIVLPALAALGAVASIAAVAWVAQDRGDADRPRVKRRIDVILKDLETSCIGVAEILRRVRRHAKQLGLDGPQGGLPLKLGLTGGRVEAAGGGVYKQLVNDLATMLVLATQNSFDAISAIEDGEIEAPESVFFGFGEAQEKLNRLLVQRASVRATIDHSIDVAQQLAGLVGELKRYKTA
jgi:hypothetical protein